MRTSITAGAVVALTGLLATVVLAGTVNGTAKNDTLRGTAKADSINGKAGNDKLYGLAGDDRLIGGAGNDLLDGGAGADNLDCGAGRDTAKADDADKIASSCETVTGLKPPVVSIADASVVEGNSGATLSFAVTLSKAWMKAASVSYATANGSASSPGDFASASGKLTFAPGQTEKTISVSVMGERLYEQDETLTVALSGPVQVTIGDGSATGTITNDDLRSGRYAGTTSQGKAVTFDVSPDATGLANLRIIHDVDCGFLGVITDLDLDLEGVVYPIASDLSVNVNESDSIPDFSLTFLFNGRLSMPGNASGTLRIDVSIGLPIFGTVSCTTGNVTWTAEAAG